MTQAAATSRRVRARAVSKRLALTLVTVCLLVAACAVSTPDRRADDREPAPPETATLSSPAVVELSEAAREALRNERFDTAARLLERTIRIEPQNGLLWHRLARVRFEQGDYEQAMALAARSNAMVSKSSDLKSRNDELIRTARDALAY